jgi:hypothetical protein
MIMGAIIYVLFFLFVLVFFVVTFYCFKFAILLIKIQENLQIALDLIDNKHARISEILQRPLFFDSPEIRQVLRDIVETKTALNEIAYTLSAEFNQEGEEDEDVINE